MSLAGLISLHEVLRISCWILFLSHFSLSFASRPIPTENSGGPFNSSLLTNASAFALDSPTNELKLPENNITCVGGFPDLKLPLLSDGFDPNKASMQQLCAKTEYGGGMGHNAGGYCWTRPGTFSYHTTDNETTGDVGFDLSPSRGVSTQLQNPRFLLACFYRCFCNYDLQTPLIQPKSRYAFFRTSMARSLFSYELQLDLNNDFTTSRLLKMGKRGAQRVKTLRVPERAEFAQTKTPTTKMGKTSISLDPANEIQCRGDLPNFQLPSPYSMSDFSSLQELCATQLSGGNMYANAGGYCHRSDTPTGPTNTVWFSDDQTPRHEWTWAGGNFFASASIRFICWRHCACSNVEPTKDNSTTSLWAFVSGHELTQRPNGAIVIQQGTGPVPKGGNRKTQVLPPQGGGKSPSGSCGADGDEFCPQPWPTSIYGEIPHAPPDTTDIIKAQPPSNDKTICGNTCNGPSDCSSSGTAYGCSCALPTTDDARTLGLDPVAPIAVCLALFATSMKANTISGKRALLPSEVGGITQDLQKPSFVNSHGIQHTCKCNATFLADECCTSDDGMVWIS